MKVKTMSYKHRQKHMIEIQFYIYFYVNFIQLSAMFIKRNTQQDWVASTHSFYKAYIHDANANACTALKTATIAQMTK